MSEGEVFIIDERRRDFYLIDNALITAYGRHIGPYAIAVYNCLSCHADKKRESFPSYRTIANETGMSRDTAMRAVQTLVDWNMVRVTIEEKPTGEYANNRYHLLDVKVWKPIASTTATGSGSQRPPKRLKQPRAVAVSNNGDSRELTKQDSVQQDSENKTQQHAANGAAPVADAVVDASLVSALVTFGVTPKSAAIELVKLSPELCRAWLDELKDSELGAGYLVKRVKAGDAPANYVDPAEAARRAEQAQAQQDELKAQADDVWKSLSEVQRERLKQDWKDEWNERYPREAYNPRNPDHIAEFRRNLIDAKTLKWLEGVK